MVDLKKRLRSLVTRRSETGVRSEMGGAEAAPPDSAGETEPRRTLTQRAAVVEALRCRVSELSHGKVSLEDIDPAMSILDCGYVDSLSSVRLLGYIEEQWGVEIPETELVGSGASLNALAQYVERETTP